MVLVTNTKTSSHEIPIGFQRGFTVFVFQYIQYQLLPRKSLKLHYYITSVFQHYCYTYLWRMFLEMLLLFSGIFIDNVHYFTYISCVVAQNLPSCNGQAIHCFVDYNCLRYLIMNNDDNDMYNHQQLEPLHWLRFEPATIRIHVTFCIAVNLLAREH